MIHHGDCIDVMAGMDPESVDAIVTDPPYGLEFMGKEWDKLDAEFVGGGPSGSERFKGWRGPRFYNQKGADQQAFHARWAEAAYRVAKPSAYLLAFGGTRTVHRMTCALEDAGWIIRDMLVWGYASGFPKSKASLKPAWEPIVMARKPGPLRMLAIDECRIPGAPPSVPQPTFGTGHIYGMKTGEGRNGDMSEASGRWPANIVLTDAIFDGGIEGVVGGGETAPAGLGSTRGNTAEPSSWDKPGHLEPIGFGDSGTYSRFFLIPKAARSDREPVLGGLPEIGNVKWQPFRGKCATCGHWQDPGEVGCPCGGSFEHESNRMVKARANVHPTVKPVDLMRHLVRLVTPTGGTVLDPFLGSGTTGLAAEMEGFAWIGIEREAEYVAIAEARLNGTQKGMAL